jgi:hypothetical protein
MSSKLCPGSPPPPGHPQPGTDQPAPPPCASSSSRPRHQSSPPCSATATTGPRRSPPRSAAGEPICPRRPRPASNSEGKLMTAPPLPAALRAGAEGLYALEAATGLDHRTRHMARSHRRLRPLHPPRFRHGGNRLGSRHRRPAGAGYPPGAVPVTPCSARAHPVKRREPMTSAGPYRLLIPAMSVSRCGSVPGRVTIVCGPCELARPVLCQAARRPGAGKEASWLPGSCAGPGSSPASSSTAASRATPSPPAKTRPQPHAGAPPPPAPTAANPPRHRRTQKQLTHQPATRPKETTVTGDTDSGRAKRQRDNALTSLRAIPQRRADA